MGGTEDGAGRCHPARPDAGVWQCEHFAGGVHSGVADGGGGKIEVSDTFILGKNAPNRIVVAGSYKVDRFQGGAQSCHVNKRPFPQ